MMAFLSSFLFTAQEQHNGTHCVCVARIYSDLYGYMSTPPHMRILYLSCNSKFHLSFDHLIMFIVQDQCVISSTPSSLHKRL